MQEGICVDEVLMTAWSHDVRMTAFLTTTRKYSPIVVAVGVGIILSGLLYFIVREEERAIKLADFDREASTRLAALQNGIDQRVEVVESIAGLYAASQKVERHEFREFVTGPLSRHGQST